MIFGIETCVSTLDSTLEIMDFYRKCSWHFDDIFKVLPLRKLVHGILLRNSKWWDQGPFIYNKGYKPIFPSPHQNIRDDGNKNICYFWTCAHWNMLWWIISKILSKSKRPVLSNLGIISRNIFTFTISIFDVQSAALMNF